MDHTNWTIEIQTPERNFEGILHYYITDKEKTLISASVMGYETVVKAIFAAIIEKRNSYVAGIQLKSIPNAAYRYKMKPIGLGDVYHGILIPRNSVWNDITDDLAEKPNVEPIILAPDGDISFAVGRYLVKRFHLPDCWEKDYYSLIPNNLRENLQVTSNPDFPIWEKLKAVRLKISEKAMLSLIEKSMKEGTLQIPTQKEKINGVFDPEWTLREFIKNNAVAFAKKLSSIKPYFDPSTDTLHWGFRLMKRTPFPAQAYKAQGLVNAMLSRDFKSELYDIGDMGTGKSISLISVLLLYHLIKQERGRTKGTSCILSAPSITLQKWKSKEFETTIPDFAKVEILHSTEDVIRLVNKIRAGHRPNKDDIEVYMISIDRAKLGHEPYFAGIFKKISSKEHVENDFDHAWHCPDCFQVLTIPTTDKEETKIAFYWDVVSKGRYPTPNDINKAKKIGRATAQMLSGKCMIEDGLLMPNGLPMGFVSKWNHQSKLKKCPHCLSSLWRPALKSRFETRNKPRYNPSKILKKAKKHFDLFCQDEVQMTAAESSGRGDAYDKLVRCAKQTLNLTGTLTSGKSTSIKEILWRANPKSLIKEGFNYETGMVQWARRYGVLKEVIEIEGGNTGVTTRKFRKALQPKEEPGIAPALVVNHILHKAAFTELRDLGIPLVELKEIPHIIQMDSVHETEYHIFHQKLYNSCKLTKKWGNFIPGTINYANRPDIAPKIPFMNNNGHEYFVTAPALNDKHASLRWLIETVKKELQEDRGVVIYNKYTDSYGLNEYIQKHLSEAGIESEILSTSTSTLQRFEWLQKQEERGTKVLITQMSLVEVGLDMMPWPTYIYNQLDYSINKIRQSSRRGWRIGQDREVRIYYPVYENSHQLDLFRNIMHKRGHALLVEGRIDRSELAQYGIDSQTAMATELAANLDSAEIAEMWKKLAAKDIDEGLETVSEEEFKKVLQVRINQLAEETLNQCQPFPNKSVEPDFEVLFTNWIKTFNLFFRKKFNTCKDQIIEEIRKGVIPGFSYNSLELTFDQKEVFGLISSETKVYNYIISYVKKESNTTKSQVNIINKQISFFDLLDSEFIPGSQQVTIPNTGQLQFELFS